MRMTLVTILCAAYATAATAGDVTGSWQTEPGETGGYAIVKISNCGSKVCGIISRVAGGRGDASVVGKRIVWDMSSKDGRKYTGGRIWAPDTDKVYKSKMEMISGDRLKVSGCVLMGTICRGQIWTRVK